MAEEPVLDERYRPPVDDMERAKRVQDEHNDELLALPNVFMVGAGLRERRGETTEEVAVLVFVSSKKAGEELSPEAVVPSELRGSDGSVVSVDVIEAADVGPLSDSVEKTGRCRPVEGSCGISRSDERAIGTAGGFVRDRVDRDRLLLTVLHNVCGSDMTKIPTVSVVQPSVSEGGDASDAIGTVKSIVPMRTVPDFTDISQVPITSVDAAAISLSPGIGESDTLHRASDIGLGGKRFVYSMRYPVQNERVWLFGARTGTWVTGHVQSVNVPYFKLNYRYTDSDPNRYARIGPGGFTVRCDGGPGFAQGDSGTLVIATPKVPATDEFTVLGMLIGGNSEIIDVTAMPDVAKHLRIGPLEPDPALWYRVMGHNHVEDVYQVIGPDAAGWLGTRGTEPSRESLVCFLPVGDKYVIANSDIPRVWTVEAGFRYSYGRLGVRGVDGRDVSSFEVALEKVTESGSTRVRLYEPTTSYSEMLGVERQSGDLIRWTPAGDDSQHLLLVAERKVNPEERALLVKHVPNWESS